MKQGFKRKFSKVFRRKKFRLKGASSHLVYARHLYRKHRLGFRVFAGFTAVLLAVLLVTDSYMASRHSDRYDISRVEGLLLSAPVELYEQKLVPSDEGRGYIYNRDYQYSTDTAGISAAPKFIATVDADGRGSITVNDAVNEVDLKITPKFSVDRAAKNKNRVVMPLRGRNAAKVYTFGGTAIKEDLVLYEAQGDSLEFDYQLGLPDTMEARPESDGSIGVYGITAELLGQVSVGSEGDQQLLERLRKKADKNNLLFTIPAPFIVEANGKTSQTARAWFSMPDTTTLRVHADKLESARYPLSIDPSIYIETARKLMRGNNETNVDFNTTNELIQKGSTTGARFDNWDNTTQLNDGRWNTATAVAGGFIYTVGGSSEGGVVTTTYGTAGDHSYVIPAGVTSVTVKVWGAGGGGGGASPDRVGGAGGGGGYTGTTLTGLTPGNTLYVRVGSGGGGGTGSNSGTNSGNGGGGGGYSGIFSTNTYVQGNALIISAGGGGGGGGNGDSGSTARQPGDDGGAGGGTNGIAGDSNGTTTGGGGGTPTTGGSAGTASGVAGTVLAGGAGGGNGTQANGGATGGANGGIQQNGGGPNKIPGGGGGGAGYYGGGGGGKRDSQYNGGGGGGGGSSFTTGSPSTNAPGNGIDPGNKNDTDRSGAGNGGSGGAVGTSGSSGSQGRVLISYSAGGAGAVQGELYWARLDDGSGAVTSPNPEGNNGTPCTNWCTSPAYDLPGSAVLQGHSIVSYNGYLYVMGGENDGVSTETSSYYTTSGVRQNKVYIAKLGANGEPQLWHPTDTNKANWVYWYEDTSSALSTERSYFSAVAYNNKMYLLGGKTNASVGGVTTVEVADIIPNGELGAWSTSGMTALPTGSRYGLTAEVYNGYLYIIGGASGSGGSAALTNSVWYNKINSDGTLNTWRSTKGFGTARMTWGGDNTTIWGGYIYLSGGCSAINATTGFCTTVRGDTQLASINADGSITDWNTIGGLSNIRFGQSIVAWRNYVYGIGGCNSHNPINGQCADLVLTNDYGTINQDGDASTVSDSVSSGLGNCTGGDPYDCDTPPLGDGNGEGGGMGGGIVINNGIIYYIGGCRVVSGSQICTSGGAPRSSDTIYYAQIANDGTLHRVPSGACTGTNIQYAGSWCVDNNSSHTINNNTGLTAFGYTVFNNVIYAIGGTTGQTWQTTVYYTALNADGSLNGWTTQTFADVGLGANSIAYPYVFARANPATAGTFPANLYVVGGCNGASTGVDCDNTFFTTVYKCKISTSGALGTGGDACTTTGQLQLDSEPGTSGNQGLGIMAGAVYANYIYLIGGQSDNEEERGSVMYAKIDNSNNIVAVSGSTWITSSQSLSPARRRGVAFGYNGYLYALAGFAVDTGLNDLLFAKIDVSDGSIGPFTVSGVTVNQRWDLRAVVSSGYVYTLGGCSSGAPPATCNGMTQTVQTFQLYNNHSGSTSDYTTSSNLYGTATSRIGASAAVLNGYLYVAGGCTSATDCTGTTNSVMYALLGDDGSVGSWTATTSLPGTGIAWGQLETAGGYLYYLGGQTGSATSTAQSAVYYALPSSGAVSSWSTASGGIGDTASQAAQNRTEFSSAVWNNRIYVVGGYNGSAVTNTVYISPQLSSGGNIAADSWTQDTDVPSVARRGHTTIAYANNLYILGGFDGTNYLGDVQYTQINTDGTIDPWSFTTSLPQFVRNADGFARNGYMYLFGGRSAAASCTTNTYITPISANTTIASGNNPTGVGEWYQTRSALNGTARYGVAAAYNQGKTYVLGGGCGATLTYETTNRVMRASLFSQPQVAHYSRLIDTDTDVFPTNWLLNGLDNNIGARWSLSYRSMHDLNDGYVNPTEDCGTSASMAQMTALGQATLIPEVTLGDVGTYTPKNSTGGDINCARYFFFSVSIDSSLTYGYPDDVTRGPTIDDLTLFFTSDPNRRLRHGKTFTGGEKQPLDTPCRQSEDADCPLP